jgi:hypothetical protein
MLVSPVAVDATPRGGTTTGAEGSSSPHALRPTELRMIEANRNLDTRNMSIPLTRE